MKEYKFGTYKVRFDDYEILPRYKKQTKENPEPTLLGYNILARAKVYKDGECINLSQPNLCILAIHKRFYGNICDRHSSQQELFPIKVVRLKNNKLLFLFGIAECSICEDNKPFIERLRRYLDEYGPRGVVDYFLNQNRSVENIVDILKGTVPNPSTFGFDIREGRKFLRGERNHPPDFAMIEKGIVNDSVKFMTELNDNKKL